MIEHLTEVLLEHILSYLCVSEQYLFFSVSHCLWATQEDYTRRLQILTIHCEQDGRLLMVTKNVSWPRQMYLNFSACLHTLELGSYCTDRFLQIITEQQLLPLLQHIRMPRCTDVTDSGLEWLSKHPGGNLETIDLTFCSNTTYRGTFCLRDRLKDSLKLLRRQPAWLDGKFQTPFNENSDNNFEVHTYYADGTFSFNRENPSRGFVANLTEWDESGSFVADKLQYSNFEPPLSWPDWTRYSYRPGVCLYRLRDQVGDDCETMKTVLVGQNLRGLRPPKIQELMVQMASTLATGPSIFFTKASDGTFARSPTRPTNGGVMITKMRVYPLDSLMPPEHLVAECRTACDMIRNLMEEVVDSGERYLNDSL